MNTSVFHTKIPSTQLWQLYMDHMPTHFGPYQLYVCLRFWTANMWLHKLWLYKRLCFAAKNAVRRERWIWSFSMGELDHEFYENPLEIFDSWEISFKIRWIGIAVEKMMMEITPKSSQLPGWWLNAERESWAWVQFFLKRKISEGIKFISPTKQRKEHNSNNQNNL